MREKVFPDGVHLEALRVADDDKEVLRSRNGHIQAVHICEEAESIRADAVEKDDILLAALE